MSNSSQLTEKLTSIKKQYVENAYSFVNGIPTALILIPLTLFLLSPSSDRGIFLFGAIFTSIVALVFTPPSGGNNFSNNYPSFHGLALGYVIGYSLMENILLSKVGSMLSSCVMGMIVGVGMTVALSTNATIANEMLHVGVGWILGIFIGMFFSYIQFKSKNPDVDSHTKIEDS